MTLHSNPRLPSPHFQISILLHIATQYWALSATLGYLVSEYGYQSKPKYRMMLDVPLRIIKIYFKGLST